MNTVELVWLFIDLVVMIMFLFMLKNSLRVKVVSKVGHKSFIFTFFILLAIVGFWRNTGFFRYVQSIIVIILGIMYLQMKSGLSADGVVLMGSLTPYKKIKSLVLSANDASIFFTYNKKTKALFFKEEQYNEFRNYLLANSVKVEKI